MIDCSKLESYFIEKKRMTKICAIECTKCPLGCDNNGTGECCSDFEMLYPKKAIEVVQQWSDKNPEKTFLSEFLKQYPKVPLYDIGVPKGICPYHLGLMNKDDCPKAYRDCVKCWNQPIVSSEKSKKD